jgi:hypothetical protein
VASLLVAWGKLRTELLPAVQAFAEDRLQIVEGIQGREGQCPFHQRSKQRLEAYCRAQTFDVVAVAAVLPVADLAVGLQVAVVISVVAVHRQDFEKIRLLAVMKTYHHRHHFQHLHFHLQGQQRYVVRPAYAELDVVAFVAYAVPYHTAEGTSYLDIEDSSLASYLRCQQRKDS